MQCHDVFTCQRLLQHEVYSCHCLLGVKPLLTVTAIAIMESLTFIMRNVYMTCSSKQAGKPAVHSKCLAGKARWLPIVALMITSQIFLASSL